uniref:F-box domain-containing protein n=1 Tax=Mycena chlorophos TaxID=658473 RepID=A0ABQ0M9R0_MYCCL|nr:predicted protein [Mycena chlorophos]
MAGFLDLPNELLLLVLEELSLDAPHDLLSLPSLCQRLQDLSLPVYFASMGMPDPTQRAMAELRSDGKPDALDALLMTSWVTSIDDLRCSLPADTVELVEHADRLSALIQKLDAVRRLTIVWAPADNFESIEDLLDVEVLVDLGALAAQMQTLLNAALKRGCNGLTLRNGVLFPVHPNVLRAGTISAVAHKLLPNNLSIGRSASWVDAQMGRFVDDTVHSLQFDSGGKHSLSRLNIESTMFLLPPCLNWTLSALRFSPISSLSLCGIFLSTKMWTAILPLIAELVPELAELTMADLHGLEGTDILVFLTKLPLLKSLKIGYTEYSRRVQSSCPDSAPQPKFWHLEHLHAPSTFVIHFLKKKSALPKLRTLCITPRKLILGFRGLRHIRQFCSVIARQLVKHRYAHMPEVCIEMRCGKDIMQRDFTADLAEPMGELARWLFVITRLVVFFDNDMSAAELSSLGRWINRFTGLVHVSLRMDASSAEEWATVDTARAISIKTPHVKTFELNGVVFDAETLVEPTIPGPPRSRTVQFAV